MFQHSVIYMSLERNKLKKTCIHIYIYSVFADRKANERSSTDSSSSLLLVLSSALDCTTHPSPTQRYRTPPPPPPQSYRTPPPPPQSYRTPPPPPRATAPLPHSSPISYRSNTLLCQLMLKTCRLKQVTHANQTDVREVTFIWWKSNDKYIGLHFRHIKPISVWDFHPIITQRNSNLILNSV